MTELLLLIEELAADLKSRNEESAKESTTLLLAKASTYLADAGAVLGGALRPFSNDYKKIDGSKENWIYRDDIGQSEPVKDVDIKAWWGKNVSGKPNYPSATIGHILAKTPDPNKPLNLSDIFGIQPADLKQNWGTTKPQMLESFLSALSINGADDQLASDFMLVRKEKKAVNSYSAFTSFMKTVEKSGKSLNEILEICIEMNWKGFRLAWLESHEVKSRPAPNTQPNQPVYKSPTRYLE